MDVFTIVIVIINWTTFNLFRMATSVCVKEFSQGKNVKYQTHVWHWFVKMVENVIKWEEEQYVFAMESGLVQPAVFRNLKVKLCFTNKVLLKFAKEKVILNLWFFQLLKFYLLSLKAEFRIMSNIVLLFVQNAILKSIKRVGSLRHQDIRRVIRVIWTALGI